MVVMVVVIILPVIVAILVLVMPLHPIQKRLNHLHSVALDLLLVKHHSRMMHMLMVACL